MIDDVLPRGAVAAQVRGDLAAAALADPLTPEEAALVSRAVEKRRLDFAAGRSCARRALERLGEGRGTPAPRPPILAEPSGAPSWPPGVVGSITHCHGYAAAAVAWAHDLASLGIDAEPHEPLPPGVGGLVVRPEEQAMLLGLGEADPAVRWDRVLFSAKEALYKAWSPHGRRIIDFTDASVTLGQDGSLAATVLVPSPLDQLTGRWVVADGLVLTAAWPFC